MMYTISAIGQDSHMFMEIGAPQMGTPQAGATQMGTQQAWMPQMGTPQAGATQMGAPQAEAPQMGTPLGEAPQAWAPVNNAAQKPLLLGGVRIDGEPPLKGNSDADVLLHALCNAISGITGVNILGEIADRMLQEYGVTDSAEYVREALKHLVCGKIIHASFSIECARPVIAPYVDQIRQNVAKLIATDKSCVGVTATSGESLTDFGRGLGIQVICVVTAMVE